MNAAQAHVAPRCPQSHPSGREALRAPAIGSHLNLHGFVGGKPCEIRLLGKETGWGSRRHERQSAVSCCESSPWAPGSRAGLSLPAHVGTTWQGLAGGPGKPQPGRTQALTMTKKYHGWGMPNCPGKTASTYQVTRPYSMESSSSIPSTCPKQKSSSTLTGLRRSRHWMPVPGEYQEENPYTT